MDTCRCNVAVAAGPLCGECYDTKMILAPVLVGFFPKKTSRDVGSMEIPGITEVCSVSECISRGPENWVQKWEHNDLGFFDTEAKAIMVLPAEHSDYDLYAYELFPFYCIDGKRTDLQLIPAGPGIPKDYVLLGYDIATKTHATSFECSPLSCNGVGAEFPVNTHCLIDSLPDAENAFVQICEQSIGEPGPYYLFKVYRKSN